MAVSKGNRKKGKKRTKNHMSPQKQVEEKQVTPKEKTDLYSLAGLAIMLVGFLGAMLTPYGLIFYPVTFVGAFMGMMRSKWDTTMHKLSTVGYVAYCVVVALAWIGTLTGKITS